MTLTDSETKPLFPPIGVLAVQADQSVQEQDSVHAGDAPEDQVVQQIESLCMNCGEQVRQLRILVIFLNQPVGHNAPDAHFHPLLS